MFPDLRWDAKLSECQKIPVKNLRANDTFNLLLKSACDRIYYLLIIHTKVNNVLWEKINRISSDFIPTLKKKLWGSKELINSFYNNKTACIKKINSAKFGLLPSLKAYEAKDFYKIILELNFVH